MWINLIFLLLFLAIVVFQASQGLFSAMLNAVLTICASALAFALYETVAVNYAAEFWKPDYAHSLSLVVVFGVSLLLMRLAFDASIKRTCLLPALVDKVGGACCALVTGLVMSGTVAVAVQMLPFGESILGFSRFNVVRVAGTGQPPSPDEERGLWIPTDKFAAGLASTLSAGVFSGEERLALDYPDLMQAVSWNNFIHHEVSRFAKPGSIRVETARPVPYVYAFTEGKERPVQEPDIYEPIAPPPGREYQMLGVKLLQGARDVNSSLFFSLRQFRLVGQEGPDGPAVQYHPIAIQQWDASQTVNRHIRWEVRGGNQWPVTDRIYRPREDHGDYVEIVFDLPESFQPRFLEYKRAARAKVEFGDAPASSDEGDESDKTTSATGSRDRGADAARTASSAPGVRSRRQRQPDSGNAQPTQGSGDGTAGNIRHLTTLPGGSSFGDDLPLEMDNYDDLRGGQTDVSRGALRAGHVAGETAKQGEGSDPKFSKFAVPRDKRLLQLNVGQLSARSGLGRAITSTVATLQNFFVQDDSGQRYKIVGKIGVDEINDVEHIEVQYFPEAVGTVGGVQKFERLNEMGLTEDARVFLLFLVDPGARIVTFSTGGSATRQDDLTAENLVAPN